MSTTYLNNEKEIVFLNSGNIAQETRDIDSIPYNAIPSLSLFNRLSDDVALSTHNVSAELSALQNVDNYLSSQISSRVVVAYKTGTDSHYEVANNLSVIELTNAEYNTLVATDSVDKKAIYVIKDSYIDGRGQNIKNLCGPVDEDDAATKTYVDAGDEATLNEAKSYANAISTSLSATVPAELEEAVTAMSDSLSTTVDYRLDEEFLLSAEAINLIKDALIDSVEKLSTNLSTSVIDSHYSVVEKAQFGYNTNEHVLSIGLQSVTGDLRVISVDAKAFIENRIIDSMTVTTNSAGIRVLRLTWKTGTAESRYVDLPLSELVKVYDEGTGITITEGDAFTIAVDFDVVAKKNDLTTLSGTVNTLKDTTVPGIAETLNTLSTTIHNSITGDIATLSNEVTAYNNADVLAGKVKQLSGDVSTLSVNLTNEFLLSADAVDAIRSTLLTEINANNSQITANAQNIGKIQSYVDVLSGDTTGTIAVLSSKIDDAVEDADQARISADYLLGASGPIAEIQTAQASIDGRIQGLSTLTDSHTGTLLGHEFNINKNADNINELSSSARAWDTTLKNALSGEIDSLSAKLSTDIDSLSAKLSTEIELLSANLSSDVDSLSGRLSTEIDNLSTSLSTTVSVDIDTLSTAIDSKVYFNGESADSLNVVGYISQAEFHNKVLADEIEDNTIYMISSDTQDMYNKKIVNLADGTIATDAANMNNLSTLANSLSSELKQKILDSLAGLEFATTVDHIKVILGNLSAAML